jgi:hypothetical protein
MFGMQLHTSTAMNPHVPLNSGSGTAVSGASGSNTAGQLSAEEQRQVQQLQALDREVHAHEQAHMRVGRELVRGAASYSYQQGPDGKQYAIGGEVRIDTTSVPGDPEATETKAYHIRDTALAPLQPSNQDRAVASIASRMAQEARVEIQRQQRAEAEQAYRQTASTPAGGGEVINQSA